MKNRTMASINFRYSMLVFVFLGLIPGLFLFNSTPFVQAAPPQISGQLTVSNQSTPYNWLHFGVDDQYSSYQPLETIISSENVSSLKQKWGAGCHDGTFTIIGGTPAFFNDNIILTYAGGRLEGGNSHADEMYWSFGDSAVGWAPPPAISEDGIVYYLYVTNDASAKLFAVKAENGEKVWEAATQFKTGFNFLAQPAIDEENDLVYLTEESTGDGRLYAVDRINGEIAWFMGGNKNNEPTFIGNIILQKNAKLLLPAEIEGEFYKREGLVQIDKATQTLDFQYELPEMKDTAKYVGYYGICNNNAYTSFIEGSLLDPATELLAYQMGKPNVLWKKEIPGQSGRFACDVQKNIVYIPTESSLIALDATSGDVIWEHKSIKSVFSPTIANGVIYYISDSNMYAVNQNDGEQLFRFPLGISANSSTGVAVNNGQVIFSGSGGECDLFVLGLP